MTSPSDRAFLLEKDRDHWRAEAAQARRDATAVQVQVERLMSEALGLRALAERAEAIDASMSDMINWLRGNP